MRRAAMRACSRCTARIRAKAGSRSSISLVRKLRAQGGQDELAMGQASSPETTSPFTGVRKDRPTRGHETRAKPESSAITILAGKGQPWRFGRADRDLTIKTGIVNVSFLDRRVTAASLNQSGRQRRHPPVTAANLLDRGFVVEEAADAPAALNRLERDTFQAIISDVVMPGAIDGLGLAREVGRRWPLTPLILVSGYAGSLTDARDIGARVLASHSRQL